jgi:type II secretory pathway predicted ATPase ExeA
LFIEQYKLDHNPFATDVARLMFESHSMRVSTAKLQELVKKQVHALFVSGPAGVGKTAFVRHRFRGVRDTPVSWIKPSTETKEQLIDRLLEDIGPGAVEGTPTELQRILEVFLRHQAGNGRYAFVIVDGLERFSPAVLRELEALSQLRWRNRPLVHFLLLTRNEDLVTNLLPLYNGGPLARAIHQRLTGFAVEKILRRFSGVQRLQQMLAPLGRHARGIEHAILDAEQDRLGVLPVDVDLRVVNAPRDSVLVVDDDTAHRELAVAPARPRQVAADRIHALARKLQAR